MLEEVQVEQYLQDLRQKKIMVEQFKIGMDMPIFFMILLMPYPMPPMTFPTPQMNSKRFLTGLKFF